LNTAIEVVLLLSGLCVLAPATVLFVEVLVGAVGPANRAQDQAARPTMAVLVPAHNESGGIRATLRALRPQLSAADRLVVIADNCSDDTAAVAAGEGAEVIVRTNAQLRGKGYALDFGVRHLEKKPPEIVVIVDADCQVSAGALEQIGRLSARSGRPVQALYLMYAPERAGLKTRIAQFAWAVKNQARPLGLHMLGLPCQLMGTGMAFPWRSLSNAQLATGHIVEDLKLGIDLALAGTPPLFCPDALVTSEFPTSNTGLTTQRTRWEHGHLGVILSEAPRLLVRSMRPPNKDLLALALDLGVPPLALLALGSAAVFALGVLFFLVTGIVAPFALGLVSVTLLAVALLLAWYSYGRRIVSLGNLAYAGVYALWKIPLYAKFLVARQLDWVRSKRDGSE